MAPDGMDDEIDLRPALRALWRHWRLIAALTVLAALAAGGFSLLLPNQYEAVAVVSLVLPNGTAIDPANPGYSLVRPQLLLAQSSDLLAEVYSRSAAGLPPGVNSPAGLAARLTAEIAADPRLLRLRARDTDPRRAAALANAWAGVLVDRAARLFPQYQSKLQLAQAQQTAGQAQLTQASDALSAFDANSPAAALTAQRDSQQASLTAALERQQALQLLAEDTDSLAARLKALPPGDPAGLADDVALLALTVRLNMPDAPLPVPAQIGAGQFLAGPTAGDQAAYAQKLSDSVAARAAAVASQVATLQAAIKTAEGQLAEASARRAELARARDLAQSQVAQSAAEVQDAALLAQQSSTALALTSRAAVPAAASGPQRGLAMLMGGALGLALGVLLASLPRPHANQGEVRAQSMA